MSTVTPIHSSNELAQSVRELRLENEHLKKQLDDALSTINHLKTRETIALKKIRQLMNDVIRYKKQFVD